MRVKAPTAGVLSENKCVLVAGIERIGVRHLREGGVRGIMHQNSHHNKKKDFLCGNRRAPNRTATAPGGNIKARGNRKPSNTELIVQGC